MFIFRFFWFMFTGIVRICLIVFVGVCLLNSTSNAVADLDHAVRSEDLYRVASALTSEARYYTASALEELGKYQVIVVKHGR